MSYSKGGLYGVKLSPMVGNREVVMREYQVRPHVGEWLEDEASFCHPRVREGELFCLEGFVSKIEDIEIDEPWCMMSVDGGSTEVFLDELSLRE